MQNYYTVLVCLFLFFFSSRRRHTRLCQVTGVQTCALPICCRESWKLAWCNEPRPSRRSEEHTSELQSPDTISYAVFCLKKKNKRHHKKHAHFGFRQKKTKVKRAMI